MSLIHYSKVYKISKNDFEGKIMIVKTKTFTSDIQTHRSARVFFFPLNLRVSSPFEGVAGRHARIARERRSDRKGRVLSWFAIRRMN